MEVKKFFYCHFLRYLSWRNANPLCWSTRTVKILTTAFFLIMLPIYFFIGFQSSLPAEAANYPILDVPSISLHTPVAPLELINHQLTAPATIAGAYSQQPNKILIIGHSSTVFRSLDRVTETDTFTYDDLQYRVNTIVTRAKSEIDMTEILSAASTKTIVIMTCAGDPLPNQDATHRLLITATAVKSEEN